MIYLLIFLFKILENTIMTLRIILVSNGKKVYGAILQIIVMLIWALTTSYVIIDIKHNLLSLIPFSFGSGIGSYLGSLIEEKLALGTIKLTIISNNCKEIYNTFKKYKIYFHYPYIDIIIPRKQIIKTISTILNIDNSAYIISEKVKIYDKFTI